MAMELASELIIGISAFCVGIAMIWWGKPNKTGENPRLLRLGFMQMIYPAAVLAILVLGVAELLQAFG
jgi:hypothetical protein